MKIKTCKIQNGAAADELERIWKEVVLA